ncbi:MAG: alpha/beta hydrolase [Ruminococcaceae bacterium]|nr:alpha/beta hydrolase [Oscillospiraceae bacterium]
MKFASILEARKLPTIWDGTGVWAKRRAELMELIQREEYGFLPPKPDSISFEMVSEDTGFCAGKAILRKVVIHMVLGGEGFSFPMYATLPQKDGAHPFFVHINFGAEVPHKFLPIEEISDNGFAVLSFCHKDVTDDANEFESGLAGVLYGGKERNEHDCGKIAMWAWAAQRVMDYAQGLPCLDMANAAVIGHSRLGKAALLAGAMDERFAVVISNNSGCSGAALSRGKKGERIDDICRSFPYWFCPNYQKYRNKEDTLPFDQHMLVAAVAPRTVYVSSAAEDDWADPVGEFLSAYAASGVYDFLGKQGLKDLQRMPVAGEWLHEGDVGYHLRPGKHYLGRADWNYYMQYIKRHMK